MKHLQSARVAHERTWNRLPCCNKLPRDVAEIDADLDVLSKEIMVMLKEVRL